MSIAKEWISVTIPSQDGPLEYKTPFTKVRAWLFMPNFVKGFAKLDVEDSDLLKLQKKYSAHIIGVMPGDTSFFNNQKAGDKLLNNLIIPLEDEGKNVRYFRINKKIGTTTPSYLSVSPIKTYSFNYCLILQPCKGPKDA